MGDASVDVDLGEGWTYWMINVMQKYWDTQWRQ